MKLDITAFGLGALALTLGGLALWASYGEVDWLPVSRALPVVLIIIGIAMLILSRLRTR
ncbi:MAG: hypothetical protein KIT69_12565 [Propionibacteriaceae bacterium]|nr:hypothetical protein [Propionibacteriaceae bacterium]